MRKVRIKGLPKAAHGGPTGGATEGLRRFMEGKKNYDRGMNQFAEPEFDVNKTLKAVDPSEANIEAEGGEYAVVPGMSGIPESYKISGPRHNGGGVPLNLAQDSFIFSDFKKEMKIKDKDILAEFGASVPKKGRAKGKTPADLAKKFDLNKFKKILLDPNSDMLERETAEQMIKNYNMKLGKLALVQESMKGFEQGVPQIALPYLNSIGEDPSQFEGDMVNQPMQAAYGAGVIGDPSQYSYQTGGENKAMSKRFPGLDVAKRGATIDGKGQDWTSGDTRFLGAFWDSILQEGGQLSMEEQMYGVPSDVTINSKVNVRGQDKFPLPEDYRGDFFHYDASTPEGENPYYKTFGDKFRNTTKIFQNPRRVKQTTVFQEGAQVKSVETIPDFRKMTPSQRSGYNTAMDKFLSTKNAPEQQDAYRKLIENLHAQSDYNIKAATDSVSNYYAPPVAVGPEVRKAGGMVYAQEGIEVGQPGETLINLDEYQTAADFAESQIQPAKDLTNAPLPTVMTEGEIIMTFGTQEEKERWLFNKQKDAEAAGLDPAKYVAEELVEMSWEELQRAEQDLKGFPWKSIKKELAKDEAIANRNAHPMKLVNPQTGEILNDNPSQKEIDTYKQAAQGTVGKNVKTTGTPVYDIPEGATIHNESEEFDKNKVKSGDYLRRKDGTIVKISKKGIKLTGTTASGPENYKPMYGSVEEDVKKAKEIMKAHPDAFKLKNGKWETYRAAADKLDLAEKELITKVASYRDKSGSLGAPGLDFGTQHSYRYDEKGNPKGRDPFYGIADGQVLEYKYWKANNPDGTPQEFEQLPADALLQNRKDYLKVVGKYGDDEIQKLQDEGRLNSPKDLFTEEFLRGDKDNPGFTKRLEDSFGKGDKFRQAHGDDFKIGVDHLDTFETDVDLAYEDVAKKQTPKDPVYIEQSEDAPWWAQDVGNMMMTVAERASLKKYMPHSYPIDLARPDVVYYDPSRALAASAEQANIAAQQVAAFAGPQGTYQLTGIQGQAFTQAANTLADYEAKNVGIANQYLQRVEANQSKENMLNAGRMQKLYDETTIANQQYDNAKRAANRNIFEAWRQGLTNATKTQTMNLLYPQYNVDPSRGGITHFTEGRPQVERVPPGSASNNYAESWKQFRKDNPDIKDNVAYNIFRDSYGLNPAQGNRQRRRTERDDFFGNYGI